MSATRHRFGNPAAGKASLNATKIATQKEAETNEMRASDAKLRMDRRNDCQSRGANAQRGTHHEIFGLPIVTTFLYECGYRKRHNLNGCGARRFRVSHVTAGFTGDERKGNHCQNAFSSPPRATHGSSWFCSSLRALVGRSKLATLSCRKRYGPNQPQQTGYCTRQDVRENCKTCRHTPPSHACVKKQDNGQNRSD